VRACNLARGNRFSSEYVLDEAENGKRGHPCTVQLEKVELPFGFRFVEQLLTSWDGKPIAPILASKDSCNHFGYYRPISTATKGKHRKKRNILMGPLILLSRPLRKTDRQERSMAELVVFLGFVSSLGYCHSCCH